MMLHRGSATQSMLHRRALQALGSSLRPKRWASNSFKVSTVVGSHEVQDMFRDIGTNSTAKGVMEEDKVYPSPYDILSKHQTASSILKIWSLLDALLNQEQFHRSLKLIDTLYKITNFESASSAATFIDAFNKYLFAWTQSEIVEMDEVNHFLKRSKATYPKMFLDGRTVAILTRAAIDKAEGTSYRQFLKSWVRDGKPIIEVLNNVDVLTIVNLKKIYEDLKLNVNDFPKQYRELVTGAENIYKIDNAAVSKQLEKDPMAQDAQELSSAEVPPTLQKLGYDELKAVDSFGLKVIRHSLLALSLSGGKDFAEKILSNLEHPEDYVNTDSQTIDFFKVYKSLKTDKDKQLFHKLLDDFNHERQRQLEARTIDGAEQSWKHTAEESKKHGGLMFKDKQINVLLWKWFKDMLPLVQEDVELCKRYSDLTKGGILSRSEISSNFTPAEYAKIKPHLDICSIFTLISPEKMTVITILEMLRLASTGGVVDGMKTTRAVMSIGKAIEYEYKSEIVLKKEGEAFKGMSQGEKSQRLRKMIQRSQASLRDTMLGDEIDWPTTVKAKVGSLLISALLKVAKISVTAIDPRTGKEVTAEVPAMSHTYQYCLGTKLGIIRLHKNLLTQLGTQNLQYSIYPQSLPMLTKPKKWTTFNSGGYEFSRNNIIRSKNSPEQMAYIKAASARSCLDKVYEGLNVLGDTAWTVNERVLKILTTVWNSEEEFLAIPKILKDIEFPPVPPRDCDPIVKRDWQRASRQLANIYSTNRSSRCDTNYKLEIARAFAGERFYFPHNLDFRGRAYPITPHFNHLGNDLSRGLLIFWEGKKLGPKGLFWLKVHLANLFGHSKLPFSERVAFVDDHMKDIEASVTDPYNKKAFWLTAEDPWQALAVMFEVTDALKLDDPAEFVSHQPVHQDGTCNGLQHYAALGGDIEGAKQVNLIASERPQDVYNHVCSITKKLLKIESEKGEEDAEKILKVIDRKVIKQTVMTNVYGVTYIGATQQIRKQLKNYFSDPDEAHRLSLYLTRFVFESIRTLFSGANLIQTWLGESARRVTKSTNLMDIPDDEFEETQADLHMSSVIWTSPLGLPVVQPYRQACKKQIATNIQTLFLQDPFELNQVSSSRQLNGFAPNYIHSLDATHMLLSSIECGKNGVTFASVHDSYWTHASSVDEMNEILRSSFVELHQLNLIEKLKEELETRYSANLLMAKVPRNNPIVEKVVRLRNEMKGKHVSDKKKKGFTFKQELALERERFKKLHSGDPELIAEAQAMETTVSILTDDEIRELYGLWNTVQKERQISIKKKPKSKSGGSGEMVSENTEEMSITEEDETATGNTTVLLPFRCPATPPRGDLNVEEVIKSKYFFS
ncbi:DNA-directed RNA polymerase [Saccharomycopsis crataegensis]|uniref:DNA-directed RNA polymerase n=1 Tax=Saccharomycopsis crataegensis TaxID=43959 RepID=A0AAV5QUY0_9ASCO|nr:DNA-directed RNA polymerase [Saccharomycopsis crataegensis]